MGWFYDTFVKDEVEKNFQPKGNYAAKGDYLTKGELDKNLDKYAKKADVVTTLSNYDAKQQEQSKLYAIQANVDKRFNDYDTLQKDYLPRATFTSYESSLKKHLDTYDSKFTTLDKSISDMQKDYLPRATFTSYESSLKKQLDTYVQKRPGDSGNYLTYGDFSNDSSDISTLLNRRYGMPEVTVTTNLSQVAFGTGETASISYTTANAQELRYRFGTNPFSDPIALSGNVTIGPVGIAPANDRLNVDFRVTGTNGAVRDQTFYVTVYQSVTGTNE